MSLLKKLSTIVIISLFTSMPVFANLPNSIWPAIEKYTTAVESNNIIDQIRASKEIISIMEPQPFSDARTNVLLNHYYQTALAYLKLNDHFNAYKYFQLYLPFGQSQYPPSQDILYAIEMLTLLKSHVNPKPIVPEVSNLRSSIDIATPSTIIYSLESSERDKDINNVLNKLEAQFSTYFNIEWKFDLVDIDGYIIFCISFDSNKYLSAYKDLNFSEINYFLTETCAILSKELTTTTNPLPVIGAIFDFDTNNTLVAFLSASNLKSNYRYIEFLTIFETHFMYNEFITF
ncbi:MAG: hypothetical protein ATN31_00005 [Candidatus Epulonipiscioides saccharophilum]|nr:MAG: hypothetical protein ATN31_00005 [Epulopiscium sp. AS2M-Bin001]